MRAIIHKLSYYVCAVGMFMAVPLMLLTTADVISRGFFNKPIPGVMETSEYMLAVIILLGAAYTQQVKGHVWVDFLTVKLPQGVQNALRIFTDLASLFIISLVVYMGYVEALEEKAVSDMLRIPQWPFKMLVAVGCFLLWLELLVDLVDSVAKLVRRETWTR
jgi:TRAP-type C4-dicarboxylate transport system permease small subunit